MAAVSCSNCGKKISSRSPICGYCGHESGEASDRDRAVYRARRLRDRIYRLNMSSYLIIAVLLGGFGWFWWESAGFSRMSSIGPFVLTGIAALAYLAVRVLLYRARNDRRSLRREAGIAGLKRRTRD